MLNSKVIQTIKIDTHFGPIEMSVNVGLKDILKRLAIEMFDDVDHYINPSVALGLLYDMNIVSIKEMFLLHEKFYYGRNLEETLRKHSYIERTEKDLKKILNKGLDRLAFYKDLLEAKHISYEDLSICQFDRVAEHFIPYPTALELMAKVSDKEFARAVKSEYQPKIKNTHNERRFLRGISSENMRILEIICSFIGVTNASQYKSVDQDLGIAIFIRDQSSKENLERLKNIIETVFDCTVEITDARNMTYEDFDNFNSQFSKTMFSIVNN